MKLGICEFYYEKFFVGNCCRVVEFFMILINIIFGLFEYLVDLMICSIKYLDFEEFLKLKKLFIKF